MELRPGIRVRARDLTWDVLDVDRAGDCDRLSLRCAEGDMAGLEWELFVPPDRVEPTTTKLDPRHPTTLSLWHLMHQAYLLDELSDGETFVARMPGRVRLEPFQLVPLMHALEMSRPRLLLADGVGLGKTIQAGLIAAELIARRRARRILIVAPSGPLLRQWDQETKLRFGLTFTLITNASDLREIRSAHELGTNPFDAISFCITALDFAKQDHVSAELERSSWDLVIIDEAHHCMGLGPHASQENTQRRKLAEVLAGRCDGLLLLTATPHDGHDAHFASLIALLDPSLVDGLGCFVGQAYRHHVVRRMKAHVRDPGTGEPLFRRRLVMPVKVDVTDPEQEIVRDFHRALSAFVVPRLRRRSATDDGLAFVSLLKRSVSTIAACVKTLRVVSERLSRDDAGESESKSEKRERARLLRAFRRRAVRFGSLDPTDETSLEMLEVESMTTALRVAPDLELQHIIQLGLMAEIHDPKLEAMLLEVRLIRLKHPKANILIYTEYADSQIAAARFLRQARGILGEILTMGGHDESHERANAAHRFAECDALILINTDSMAEGLNLHRHCFHLIHLDLPYNPNRLEQRNGRIDRYGQQYEPEIRYLYIPGTFEEGLLLHLITKYEKARSFLDVMPNTLGVAAIGDDQRESLIGRLSEDPTDLFGPPSGSIRTLDRAVEETGSGSISALMREIDRTYDAFDLMAVSHGWYGARGLNADTKQLTQVDRLRGSDRHTRDFVRFVGDVIATETGKSAIVQSEIKIPQDWSYDLRGLPGFDVTHSRLRFTRDADSEPSGHQTDFLGRAHPLVRQAIARGRQLVGGVSVSRADHIGLILTFEMEIRVSHRSIFRQIVAIMTRPDRPPVEMTSWLDRGDRRCVIHEERVWDRMFASWGDEARSEADQLISQIASQRLQTFAIRHRALTEEGHDRSRRWLHVEVDHLCGSFVPRTADLFDGSSPEVAWRDQKEPLARLIAFATDPETLASKRRKANDTLALFRTMDHSAEPPGEVVCRPIGLLMLVPEDAL